MWSHLEDVWVAAAFSYVLMRGKWTFQSWNAVKRGYVRRLHAAIEGGKYPLQTMWLPVYKTEMVWTCLWNATQDFWCFPEQCPALGFEWFFGECCPQNKNHRWGRGSETTHPFPGFQPPSLNAEASFVGKCFETWLTWSAFLHHSKQTVFISALVQENHKTHVEASGGRRCTEWHGLEQSQTWVDGWNRWF